MNKKTSILSLSAVLLLLCGLFSSKNENIIKTNADEVKDLGILTLHLDANHVDKGSGIYLTSEEANDFPYDSANWTTRLYSNEANSVLLNGVDVSKPTLPLVKPSAYGYYLGLLDVDLADRNAGDTVVIQGHWTNTISSVTYIIEVDRFEATWDGSKWKQNIVVPELEAYDKISLSQVGFDDFNKEKIDIELNPCCWNTYVRSEENISNSFSFEFAFEAYGDMGTPYADEALNIRIGNNGTWDTGYYYLFVMCNVWGPKGVMKMVEKNGTTPLYDTKDIACDLTPGARHIIEFGTVKIKDSDKNFLFVKLDNEYYYTGKYVPSSRDLTTRVGMYCASKNVFVGSTIPLEHNNTDTLTFDRSNGADGLYLKGPENAIPVDAWNTRAIPASNYHVLRNGQPLYNLSKSSNPPLIKHDADSYYLSFSDYGLTFNKGDVVSINNEFKFYVNDTTYLMSFKPINFLFNGSKFELISNFAEFMSNKLDSHINRDYYDDDKVLELDSIIQSASIEFQNTGDMKDLWDKYYSYIVELDAIPMNEEKAKEVLAQKKLAAVDTLNSLADYDNYEQTEIETIEGYVANAINQVNDATSVPEVDQIIEDTRALIDALPTKQTAIEEKILNHSADYESYLASYDVITTSDLYAKDDLYFYPFGSSEQGFSTGGLDSMYSHFAHKKDNNDGNVVFQFKYRSSNPLSNKYGSQVFLRLRGNPSNAYLFSIARNVENKSNISFGLFTNDKYDDDTVKYAQSDFQPDKEYVVECGAIDLKDYNRVFLYAKVDGEFLAQEIVDKIAIETTSNVLIMDSYLASDSNEYTVLSPFEEFTTKNTSATVLGKMNISEKTTANCLVFNLRDNDIPVGAVLYPIVKDFISINNQADNDLTIRKNSKNEYQIDLPEGEYHDGDTIHIDGAFAYYDLTSFEKAAYRMFQTNLVFEESFLWTALPLPLNEEVYEAKQTVQNYLDLSLYSSANQEVINGIINNACNELDNATAYEEVDSILAEALANLDAVLTILGEFKKAAKEELASYKSPDIYREEEIAELNQILSDAYAAIDGETQESRIISIVNDTKSEIDKLRTNEQYLVEELNSEKKVYTTDLESFVGLVDFDRYSEEVADEISALAYQAIEDIRNATSLEEIQEIVNNFKETVKNYKTNDGSTFNGETYIAPNNSANNNVWIVPVAIGGGLLILVAIFLLVCKKKTFINVQK